MTNYLPTLVLKFRHFLIFSTKTFCDRYINLLQNFKEKIIFKKKNLWNFQIAIKQTTLKLTVNIHFPPKYDEDGRNKVIDITRNFKEQQATGHNKKNNINFCQQNGSQRHLLSTETLCILTLIV